MTKALMLVCFAFLVSCSSTSQSLETQASAKTATYEYAENYQEIYRRLADTAKRCVPALFPLGARGQFAVDSELYSELRLGEISMSAVTFGVSNFYWKAKIEPKGSGTVVHLISGNTISNDIWLGRLTRWLNKSEECNP